jgi:hypothetical protein
LPGIEVISEYMVQKAILMLVIPILTDHYNVEMSHYVPRLIMYRLTLLYNTLELDFLVLWWAQEGGISEAHFLKNHQFIWGSP